MHVVAPSLPSLQHLPIYLTIDVAAGYLYGKLIHVNPNFTATICAIRALTHTLFYHIANYMLGGDGLQSQKIFLVTSTVVNMSFVIVSRELNLIGRLFSCLLGLGVIGYLFHRVLHIQEQERQLILDGNSE
jgi:hypothetical protein